MSAKTKKPEGLQTLLTISHRAPLEEPGCRVVDAVVSLLMAACRAEYVDAGFAAVCATYGLVEYGKDDPSDVGILNFLQPLTDAAFHSRKHREAEEEARQTLEYRESMRVRDEAQKATERRVELMDRVDLRYIVTGREGSIDTGLFTEEVTATPDPLEAWR